MILCGLCEKPVCRQAGFVFSLRLYLFSAKSAKKNVQTCRQAGREDTD